MKLTLFWCVLVLLCAFLLVKMPQWLPMPAHFCDVALRRESMLCSHSTLDTNFRQSKPLQLCIYKCKQTCVLPIRTAQWTYPRRGLPKNLWAAHTALGHTTPVRGFACRLAPLKAALLDCSICSAHTQSATAGITGNRTHDHNERTDVITFKSPWHTSTPDIKSNKNCFTNCRNGFSQHEMHGTLCTTQDVH